MSRMQRTPGAVWFRVGMCSLIAAVGTAGWAWNQGWFPSMSPAPATEELDLVTGIEAEPAAMPELPVDQSEPELTLDDETAPRLLPKLESGRSQETDPVRRRSSRDIRQIAFEENETPAPAQPEEPPPPVSTAAKVRPSVRDGAPAKAVAPDGDKVGAARRMPLLELAAIEEFVQNGDYATAQRELSRWFWQSPDSRLKIQKQLNDNSKTLYFLPQPHIIEPYVIQPGDQLRVVARKYNVSWEYLSKLNRVDAARIRAGQKLKVIQGPFSAYVNLSNYELVLHLNGSFVKSYRVGVGKDGTTPLGTFTVKNKVADPTYYGPEGVIAHDDPTNPLGERWIDIGDSYGIHGTIEPNSIGKNESRGCVRMLNSDVEEVYDFLVIGSEVRIVR